MSKLSEQERIEAIAEKLHGMKLISDELIDRFVAEEFGTDQIPANANSLVIQSLRCLQRRDRITKNQTQQSA